VSPGTLVSMRENGWTRVLGWPGYKVYRAEIDEQGERLKLWVRRKRANKNAAWVRNRYYHAIGERTRRFAVRTNIQNPLGQPSRKQLLYAGSTPMQRHRKIKGEANPFDPGWRSYFAQRDKGSTVRQTVADDRLSTPESLHMA